VVKPVVVALQLVVGALQQPPVVVVLLQQPVVLVLQLVVLVEVVVAEGVVGAGADVERHSLLECNARHSDKGWILFL